MVKDRNRNTWQVWEERVEGPQEVKDRMRRTCVATDVENGMLLPKSTEFGKGSFSALADKTNCLTGNKVLEEEEKEEEERGREKIRALATNKILDFPTHIPITLLTKQLWLYVMHKDQSLEQLNR